MYAIEELTRLLKVSATKVCAGSCSLLTKRHISPLAVGCDALNPAWTPKNLPFKDLYEEIIRRSPKKASSLGGVQVNTAPCSRYRAKGMKPPLKGPGAASGDGLA